MNDSDQKLRAEAGIATMRTLVHLSKRCDYLARQSRQLGELLREAEDLKQAAAIRYRLGYIHGVWGEIVNRMADTVGINLPPA